MDTDDYDKILLSFKEKRLLRQIIRKDEVPISFCNVTQKAVFLKYGLIRIIQDQTLTSSGRVTYDPGTERIKAEDKAFRYFLYRKENYFKGKLPVVIAIIALVKSFDVEICRLAHFILGWLSSL